MNQLAARGRFWWSLFRVSLEERLVYRGDFAFGTLMRFLPIITQIYLWWAIFEAVAGGQATQSQQATQGSENINQITIENYSLHDMIAYLLLVMLARAFSSMPGLTSGIATSVQTGEVKKFLIQPVDMLGCLLLQRVAHKLVYYIIAFLPFAFVFFLCRSFFDAGFPSPTQFCVLLAALCGSFLLGFFIEACLGLVSFWFLEVTSLAFVYMLMNFFLSGHMFPLDLLPAPFDWLVGLLPFQYLAYFPSAVALGKLDTSQMLQGLMIEYAWVLFFFVLSRFLWHRGLIRYGGYGG